MITCYTQDQEKIMFLLNMTGRSHSLTEIAFITGLSIEVTENTLMELRDQDHIHSKGYGSYEKFFQYIEKPDFCRSWLYRGTGDEIVFGGK